MQDHRSSSEANKTQSSGAHNQVTTRTLSRGQYTEIPASAYFSDTDEQSETGGLIEYWRILRRHRGTWLNHDV